MSLQISIEDCAQNEWPTDQNERTTLETLAEATIAVGISRITKSNYHEFYARIAALEKLTGAFRVTVKERGGPIEGVYVTLEEVKQWIGLDTNASAKSRTAFGKTLLKRVDEIKLRSEREETQKIKTLNTEINETDGGLNEKEGEVAA